MTYSEPFSESELARNFVDKICGAVSRRWTIMDMCGPQTHMILQYGLDRVLKDAISFVHGPGCAICITPLEEIDRALAIAQIPDVTFCVYGELLRVPGSRQDLLDAKANGADVRVVYSPMDCLTIAQEHADRKVVFFAVGSETSLHANALAVWQAAKAGIKNFFVLSSQVCTPPVCSAVLRKQAGAVDGLLGPGQSCSVMGYREYEAISREFRLPVVITGLEPCDLLEAVYRCVMQLEHGKHVVENQFARDAVRAGNAELQTVINRVFEPADASWRRLGTIVNGAYKLKADFKSLDAELHFDVNVAPSRESPVCISDEILLGTKKPYECPAFGKACSPQCPIGATMVSSHGTCAVYFKFDPERSIAS